MRTYSLSHLDDRELLRNLTASIKQERSATALVLAHIGEVDARKLYLPAGFPSMFAYCVHELDLSEDAAYKRIQAARTARQFPAILPALGEGRLHLTAVNLLAPHLTPENAGALIDDATRRTKSEIELLLAQRFPRTELMPMVYALPTSAPQQNDKLAPAQVEQYRTRFDTNQLEPAQVQASAPRPKVAPLSAESFALHLTIGKDTHEKLRHAQALLSHRVPSGDLAQVLDRALDALIGQLEKQKFAATGKPRTGPGPTTNKRHIPAHVKRAVWERDQSQCTYTSTTGHRCRARKFLEFDHVDPVARGGDATVAGLRLRCRAHNQFEAECTFGADFMAEKREAARRAAKEAIADREARAIAEAHASEEARTAAEETRVASDRDTLSALRTLGFRAEEVRNAMAFSATLADAPLEQRVRLALSYLRPRVRSHAPPANPGHAS